MNKKIIGRILTISLFVSVLIGCGSTENTGGGDAVVSGEDAASAAEDGAQTELTDADAQTAAGDTEEVELSPADDMVGEWVYICTLYHSDDEDGEYDYVTTLNEEEAPDSEITVRKDGDRFLTDYKYQQYEYRCLLYGVELDYRKGAAYDDADNQSWFMRFKNPFDEDDSGEYIRAFTLTDDDRLVVSGEYFSDPDDEYQYHSLNLDIYLRKDAPEFNNPEDLMYFDTVTVSDATELLNSIQSNRKIILEEGVYNFSEVNDREVNNVHVENLYDEKGAYLIDSVYNLSIEAADGAEVEICIDDPYNSVIAFNGCGNIRLKGITAGHHVEHGYCGGSVVYFYRTDGIDIEDCGLYGSGTYGVETYYSYNISVTNTEIYECTYGLVYLFNGGDISFNNCVLRDTGDLSLIYAGDCYDVIFEDCEFRNNISNAFSNVSFVEMNDNDTVTFIDCSFENNEFFTFSGGNIVFEDCTFDEIEQYSLG